MKTNGLSLSVSDRGKKGSGPCYYTSNIWNSLQNSRHGQYILSMQKVIWWMLEETATLEEDRYWSEALYLTNLICLFSSRLFKCEPVPDSTLDKLLSVLGDRLRVPTFFGQGAVKIKPDIFTPIFVVPSCLYLATLHPIMTMAMFAFMPCFIITFHALWRRAHRDAPTTFFYSWGLTSVISAYAVFQVSLLHSETLWTLMWLILMLCFK